MMMMMSVRAWIGTYNRRKIEMPRGSSGPPRVSVESSLLAHLTHNSPYRWLGGSRQAGGGGKYLYLRVPQAASG